MYQLLSNYEYPFNDLVGQESRYVKAIVNEKISLDHIKCVEGKLNSQSSFVEVIG